MIDRRELLAQMTAILAGAAAGCRPRASDTRADAARAHAPGASPAATALSPIQRASLEAVVARILPTDADPGAREANVIGYVDRELARPEYALLRTNVLAGVVALDRASKRSAKATFAELAPREQDEVLRQVERGSERGKDFMRFMISLTLEGFFGDPRHGGNLGGAGWKLAGYGPGNPDGSGEGGHAGH